MAFVHFLILFDQVFSDLTYASSVESYSTSDHQ